LGVAVESGRALDIDERFRELAGCQAEEPLVERVVTDTVADLPDLTQCYAQYANSTWAILLDILQKPVVVQGEAGTLLGVSEQEALKSASHVLTRFWPFVQIVQDLCG